MPRPASAGSFNLASSFPLVDQATEISWFGTNQQVEPPDTNIAVGDTNLMEMANSTGSVWAKSTGTLLAHNDLHVFFNTQVGHGITDPRVIYDASTQRWFATGLEFDSANDSWVWLMVSKTSDPTGAWTRYPVNGESATLQDQPKLGMTADKLLVTWNDFNSSAIFTGVEAVVFQKSDAVAGNPLTFAWLTGGPDASRFNLIPVQTMDGSSTGYFTYNLFDANGKSIGKLGLISIFGTPIAKNVGGFETDLSIAPTAVPPPADQPSPGPKLATNDDSFTAAALSNGNLWVVGNDGCFPLEATERSCVRAVQLSLAGGSHVVQDVDLGQTGGHLFFPAASLDTASNLVVGFTASSISSFASVAATGQAAATIGSFARGWIFAPGSGVYDCGTCNTGFNGDRWGDYAAAAADPTSGDVWVANEYAPSASNKADWGTAAAHLSFGSSVLKTAMSTAQYRLDSSDGTAWVPMDPSQLALNFTPASSGNAILDGNVDLWTANAGINQDIGIFVSTNGGPDTLVAWKESGGFAGTFSPNAAFVHDAMSVTAAIPYRVSLRWKANKSALGTSIFAGAGPIGGSFSPTRLTARIVESGSSALSKVSTNQYSRPSGSNWLDIDSAALAIDVPATANAVAVISGNADLWTVNAGFNQDLGLAVNGSVIAWKESGGFAGTFSPNAAFVQTVVDASTALHVSLQWKTNTNVAGGEIRAGAGLGPYSPTRLTVELVPKTTVVTAVSNAQYRLTGSDGKTWLAPDPTVLQLQVNGTPDCLAIVSVNVDLWTATAGVNQDIGLALTTNSVTDTSVVHSPAVIAWKESGGNAGTFSPNAAFLETVVPIYASNGTYSLTAEWKSNIPTSGTIFAGAGLSPNFSPTRITAQLICS